MITADILSKISSIAKHIENNNLTEATFFIILASVCNEENMSSEKFNSNLENEKPKINVNELGRLLVLLENRGNPDQRYEAQQLEEFLGY